MRNLQSVVRQGFRKRLFRAHTALEAREGGRVSREEIGKRVGKALGTDAINQSTIASWFTEILPPADVGIGLAQVYSVPGGWLYFNEGELPRFERETDEQEGPLGSTQHQKRKRSGE